MTGFIQPTAFPSNSVLHSKQKCTTGDCSAFLYLLLITCDGGGGSGERRGDTAESCDGDQRQAAATL